LFTNDVVEALCFVHSHSMPNQPMRGQEAGYCYKYYCPLLSGLPVGFVHRSCHGGSLLHVFAQHASSCPCGGDSCRNSLQKSGIDSKLRSTNIRFYVPFRAGVGGTTTGSPKWARVRPSRIQCTTDKNRKLPIGSAVGGNADVRIIFHVTQTRHVMPLNGATYLSDVFQCCLRVSIGLPRAFRGPKEVPRTSKSTAHGGHNARRALAWRTGASMCCISTARGPKRPRKARFKKEALLSNVEFNARPV
jgi:hypothetical protein